jgi:hypothetical protein
MSISTKMMLTCHPRLTTQQNGTPKVLQVTPNGAAGVHRGSDLVKNPGYLFRIFPQHQLASFPFVQKKNYGSKNFAGEVQIFGAKVLLHRLVGFRIWCHSFRMVKNPIIVQSEFGEPSKNAQETFHKMTRLGL